MTPSTLEYDPFAPAVQADPYPFYARLRRDAPVQYLPRIDAYAVSRHADVRRILHDNRRFSSAAMAELVSRPVTIGSDAGVFDGSTEQSISIIGLDGEDHTRLRKIVNRGFTPARIARLESRVRVLARTFVARLVGSRPVDLQAAYAVPLPVVVIAELLGVDGERRAEFRRWSEDMVHAVFEPTSPEQQARIAASGEEMGAWLEGVIAQHDGTGGDDLVSVLLRAELEGGALTHSELEVFVFTLLVAGSITTAYLIGNAAMSLTEDPALADRARRDPSLVGAIVEESLRHDSPVQMMFRTATTDTEVAGSIIPGGSTVIALLGSANRDEAIFVDPDRFDTRRPSGDHLAFGHGVHHCLGAALARLEARVALEELLAATTHLEAAGPLERANSVVFYGPARLPMLAVG